jgi:hypothetical protein
VQLRYARVPLFEYKSADLRPDAARAVQELASLFKSDLKLASIVVVGHTDSIGGPEYNYKLGLERASAVVSSLVKHGVDPRLIEALSLGLEYPTESNGTDGGRAVNRRVEFLLSSQPRAGDVLPRRDFNPCHRVDHVPGTPCPPDVEKPVVLLRPDQSGVLRSTGESIALGRRPTSPLPERPIRRTPIDTPRVRPTPND